MEESIPSESLWDRLGTIPDPRSRQGRRYPLRGLLGILVLGALQGEGSLRGMWLWGCAHWREMALPLGFLGNPHPPVYGTVWYLLSALDADALDKAFQGWVQSWSAGRVHAVSVDGKVLRGSQRRNPSQAALEVVTAVSQELKVVLGQQGVGAGGQVAATIKLLQTIPLAGKVVVADAGLLCRSVVDTVVDGGGDYLGVVKGNEPGMKEALDEWITPLISPPGAGTPSG
jgi:hypothetical protein